MGALVIRCGELCEELDEEVIENMPTQPTKAACAEDNLLTDEHQRCAGEAMAIDDEAEQEFPQQPERQQTERLGPITSRKE